MMEFIELQNIILFKNRYKRTTNCIWGYQIQSGIKNESKSSDHHTNQFLEKFFQFIIVLLAFAAFAFAEPEPGVAIVPQVTGHIYDPWNGARQIVRAQPLPLTYGAHSNGQYRDAYGRPIYWMNMKWMEIKNCYICIFTSFFSTVLRYGQG